MTDAPVKDDALDLLAEIQGAPAEKVPDAEPTAAPPARSAAAPASAPTHTVLHNESQEKSDGGTPSKIDPDEVVVDFDK